MVDFKFGLYYICIIKIMTQQIPIELYKEILIGARATTIINLSSTNKHFNNMSQDDNFWKEYIIKNYNLSNFKFDIYSLRSVNIPTGQNISRNQILDSLISLAKISSINKLNLSKWKSLAIWLEDVKEIKKINYRTQKIDYHYISGYSWIKDYINETASMHGKDLQVFYRLTKGIRIKSKKFTQDELPKICGNENFRDLVVRGKSLLEYLDTRIII
jgi:hypothetical protein